MTTQKPIIYRLTGVAPGTPVAITSLVIGAKDLNSDLTLHPVKRGSPGYSFVVNLALGFAVDPGTATRFTFWATLTGGALDTQVVLKIATTLPAAYIAATGTDDVIGTSINALYGLATESIFTYSSGNPKILSGSDLVKTTGTGLYTKTIPLQVEVGATAVLGAIPAAGITLNLHCSARES